MAAAVAGAAVALGRLSGATRVEAADGDPILISRHNTTATTQTIINKTGGPTETAILVVNANGDAINAISSNTIGVSALGVNQGVLGASNSNAGTGVYGTVNAATGQGVLGSCVTAIGVFGQSTSNFGVLGSSPQFHAIHGSSGGASAAGVLGINTNATGVGVWGRNNTGIAVQATSTSSVGLFATSTSNTAVVGRSTTGRAAEFFGAVEITGDFTATGIKSAAVRIQDGSMRRMYCLESPESYFEDMGYGQLTGGQGGVRIDDTFASTVNSADYFVFLTPEGECHGLFVESKSPRGFSVRELQGGTSTLRFSWRVVAKRAGIENERFAPVKLSGNGSADGGPRPVREREVQIPPVPAAPTLPTGPGGQRLVR